MASRDQSTSASLPSNASQANPTIVPSDATYLTPNPSTDNRSADSTEREHDTASSGAKSTATKMGQTQASIYCVQHSPQRGYEHSQIENDFVKVEDHDTAISNLITNLNAFSTFDRYTPEQEVTSYIGRYNETNQKILLSLADGKTHNDSQLWSALVSVQSEIPAPSLRKKLAGKVRSGTKSALKALDRPRKPDGQGWEQI